MNNLHKWAVLGKGNTGSKVVEELTQKTGSIPKIFCSQNTPSRGNLDGCAGIIAFVPSNVLLKYVPLLLEEKIPLVSGATGLSWPEEITNQLQKNNLTWISGSNFSLGMRAIYQMISALKKANSLFENVNIKIHEIHHKKKLDAPSGTALSWSKWVSDKSDSIEISYERVDDIVGDHQLTFNTGSEQISLRHEALDRSVFAKGAIWAAEYLENEKLTPGLHYFENLTKEYFTNK